MIRTDADAILHGLRPRRAPQRVHRLAPLLAVLLLAGCAAALPRPADRVAERCLDLYDAVDQAVAETGVTPSSPERIEGFPYLRVNRFLASYRDSPLDPAQRRAWLARLAQLDEQARAVELMSLPQHVRSDLEAHHGASARLPQALADCSATLRTHDLASAQRWALLRERAAVPSEYRTVEQVLGLYPLAAVPVTYGIFLWHEDTLREFALPLDKLAVHGRLQRFTPPPSAGTTPSFAALPRDALGIPQPTATRLDALFDAHAPIWEIDVAGAFDRPGVPLWQRDGVPSVNPSTPAVYRYVSHTRWRGEALLQLNYLLWFAERPSSGPFDILGGALDGLIWRVTLDREGKPLVYDSIHPCGCYHLFFPTPALRARDARRFVTEPPLIPQPAPALSPGQRIVVRIASASHYIQRVYSDASAGHPYTWRDYRELYGVPAAEGGRRSLFGRDGLITGTERRERWLLWPMGVPSPGAMREPGRHATAFVGRRHFDDADLLERFFEPGGVAW